MPAVNALRRAQKIAMRFVWLPGMHSWEKSTCPERRERISIKT